MKKAILIVAALLFNASYGWGATVFSTGFDSPEYILDASIDGQNGWTTAGSSVWARVKSEAYGGWTGHGQHLIVNGYSFYAVLPNLDCTATPKTRITFDMKPGDYAKTANTWAGGIEILDAAGYAITSMTLVSDGLNGSSGYIAMSNGNTSWWDTGLDWSFNGPATTYTFEITIDSASQTWSLSVNGGSVVSGSWGGFMGKTVSENGSVSTIRFRGGNNNAVTGLVSFDNIVVETIVDQTLYSTNFEESCFVAGSLINGVGGWTSIDKGYIRDASYNAWGSHGKYLSCWTTSAYAYAPVVDTSGCSTVAISLDFRPADGTTGGADPNGGGYIGLYGSPASSGGTDRGITLIRFDSTGVDTGNIVASTNGTDNYVTLGTWTYVDSSTNYHFDIQVDNGNRTTTISINGGEPVTLFWGGSFGKTVCSGTFDQIWFRGGLNATTSMTSVDNLIIEKGPEPDPNPYPDALYHIDFEPVDFAPDASISTVAGWTTNLSDRGLIRNAAYNTWADHRKYLSCWTPDVRVYSPVIDTGDCSTVAISLDFRPADGTTGGADPNGGGYIGLYGTTTEGGPNDQGITLIRFDSTGVDTGNIVASTGGSDNFVTLGTWTYVDSNTNYHFDILVDNVNRMTTISIDGGEPVTLNWGGSFGTAMSSGTFNQIWFRGGLNATNSMTAVDNLLIEEGPAVAAAPTFTPDEMFITGPTEVTISSVTQNAVIYYTLDGSTPTKNSPTYGSSPLTVTVNGGDTLSAIAVADGFDNSPVSRQGFRTRTIPIVAWIGMPSNQLTLERFLELREAGFTHQLSQYYASFDYARWALDKAREAGIKFIPPVIPSYTAWCVEQIKDHPALEAYYVDDEPNASEFSSVAQTAATIQTLDPNHWCYINLFSNYADLSWGVSTYQDYVDNFLNTVSVPVLSFDHYPITSTGINPLFYENLEVISTAAKQKGIPFWAFALSSPHYDYSMPTLAHLRFQMFSNLAYGAQGLQYFTYWMCIADSISGPMDLDGNRTPIWYIVQEMNAEIVGLSPVFFGAEVMSVGHTGSLPSGTTAYTNSAPINSLTTSGSDGAVVSRLTNGDNDYLVVVNRDIVSTMTLNIGLDTSKTFTRVSKDGSETPVSGGTVSYTVAPADIVILKWSNVTPRIPGDANEDGVVNVGDLGILAANYGRDLQAQGVPQAQWWGLGDFNNDGVVNVGDLGILAANYGSSGSSFQADYAKVFGTMSDDASTDDDDDIAGSLCGGLGLPLVAGLALMGLMLIKLDE